MARILEQAPLDATDSDNLNTARTTRFIRDRQGPVPCCVCDRCQPEMQQKAIAPAVSIHCLELKSDHTGMARFQLGVSCPRGCNATGRPPRRPTVSRPHCIVVAVRRGRWPGWVHAGRAEVGEISDVYSPPPQPPGTKLSGKEAAHACLLKRARRHRYKKTRACISLKTITH